MKRQISNPPKERLSMLDVSKPLYHIKDGTIYRHPNWSHDDDTQIFISEKGATIEYPEQKPTSMVGTDYVCERAQFNTFAEALQQLITENQDAVFNKLRAIKYHTQELDRLTKRLVKHVNVEVSWS